MKRFLSVLVLFAGYFAFYYISCLDGLLLSFIVDLYGRLSPFLKLLIIIFGGSFIGGIAFIPFSPGIPMLCGASESIYPSKRNLRYFFVGGYAIINMIFSIIYSHSVNFPCVWTLIFGIVLVITGFVKMKQSKDEEH